ncbi:MAG: polysaccharide biosynthesis/export family protein [Gemmatimonadetes bacterium]|nr:polysaccharide biosynthesis/export family protein [Gemmatimonadota bacterium]
MRKWTTIRELLGAALIAALVTSPARAQQTTVPVMVNAERAMVTRSELESALKEIEQNLAGSGYSAALRTAKKAQADAIRERLSQGDLRVGDLIRLDVVEVSSISNLYQVSSTRTISLPGAIEISVAGLLRSELQDYLTTQLKKLVRDPTVRVVPTIRISVFGAVGKPGFVTPPATTLLSDVIQQFAGGPSNNVRWEKSKIMRGDKVVVDGPEFRDAVNTATTIDQLNLQAGDVIDVATKPAGGTLTRVIGAVGGVASIIWLITRISN